MFGTLWHKLTSAVESFAKAVDDPHYEELSTATSRRSDIPSPHLPQRPDIRTILVCNGVSDRLITSCAKCFNETVDEIEECLRAQYETTVSRVCIQNSYDAKSHTGYVQALERHLAYVYSDSLEKLVNTMLAHMVSSGDACASPLASSSRVKLPFEWSHRQDHTASQSAQARKGRPHLFTKEQTKVLQALLAHDDQFSTEDKELIAQTLDLTREQVNRWVRSLLFLFFDQTLPLTIIFVG